MWYPLAIVQERASYIEAKLDSLATKADLSDQLKWIIGAQLLGYAAAAAVISAVIAVLKLVAG